jgi:hypothetical protein
MTETLDKPSIHLEVAKRAGQGGHGHGLERARARPGTGQTGTCYTNHFIEDQK